MSLNYFFHIKEKELNTINAFALLNMFTQCDVIKNLARRYLLLCCNITSHSINFKFLWRLSLKWKCLLLFLCRYIIKTLCLATDACLTADPGVASSIPVRSHTFMEFDHEMISTVISLPLFHSRRVVVSYKRKYVHELLVKHLFKPAQEKLWLGELTVPQ